MMSTLHCLLFVALTLAQATFIAALNPPSDDEFVIASQLFIWCDVLSMVSSLLAAACVIRAEIGDRELAEEAQYFSAAFNAVAAVMMAAAFTLAFYIRLSGEAIIFVVGIGIIFTVMVSPVVFELLFRPRWSRLPSFLFGRA